MQDFKPFKRQWEALELLRDNLTNEVLYGGGARGGKYGCRGSKILTPNGWKLWEDLLVGDRILHPSGTTQKIIQIKPWVTLPRAVVSFSDNTQLTVTEDHLWQAWMGGNARKIHNKEIGGQASAQVVETRTLKEWLERGYYPQIPVNKPLTFTRASREKNQIDPYLLGVILGDGCTTQSNVTIASHQDDIPHYIKELDIPESDLTINPSVQYFRIKGETNKLLKKKLKTYKLLGKKSHNKFVPQQFLWSSKEKRLALFQGLMDTDGTSSQGKNELSYTTVSKQLSEDVEFIVRSLGGTAKTTSRIPTYTYLGEKLKGQLAYRVYIRFPDPDLAFRLKRKQLGSFGNNLVQKKVISVEVGAPIEGRCITVSNPDGLYITNDFIVTHNSYLGCNWIIIEAFEKPGSSWLVGRKRYSDLRDTTLITFNQALKDLGLEKRMKWKAQEKRFEVDNGSLIFFKDIDHEPSDPEYDRLGSYDLTGDFLDEAQEIHPKAISVLRGRFSKLVGDGWETIPKSFYSCNPAKTWIYSEFYRPWVDGKLSKDKAFIPSLVTDNPYVGEEYIKSLKKADKITVRRLLHGDFEYEDAHGVLMNYDAICDIFTNSITKNGEKYMTVDVAGEGVDMTKFYIWEDLEVVKVESYKETTPDFCINKIIELAKAYQVPFSHIVVDAIGIGDGVARSELLIGIIGYKGSVGAFQTDKSLTSEMKFTTDFKNLRSQCGFLLAEMVNNHRIAVKVDGDVQENLKEELGIFIDVTKEGAKRQLISKTVDSVTQKSMKTLLGRSPDDSDNLLMRMYFNVRDTATGQDSHHVNMAKNKQRQNFNRVKDNLELNSSK